MYPSDHFVSRCQAEPGLEEALRKALETKYKIEEFKLLDLKIEDGIKVLIRFSQERCDKILEVLDRKSPST